MNEQTAEVVRLRNQGVMPKDIAARLNLNRNTVASRLWSARQAGLVTAPIAASAVSMKPRPRKKGDGNAGATAVSMAQQRTAAPELRKTTPARDAVIRELYPVEQNRMLITDRVNQLPGAKVDWNDITWRASHLGLRRPPALVSKVPLSPAPASAAFIGSITATATRECCWPTWPEGERHVQKPPVFCCAPVAVITRRFDKRIMQYCDDHCRRAFTNWPRAAVKSPSTVDNPLALHASS